MIIISVVTVSVLMFAWIAAGLLPSRGIEEPNYELVQKTDIYEIRHYRAYIMAKTEVSGSYGDATSEGFRIIAGYIFGGNVSKQKIAMTAPVVQSPKSEKIAMTAPVVATQSPGGRFELSFVMPSSYTLETLPKPNDSRVELVEVPARRVAVLRFSGYATSSKVEDKTKELQGALERDGLHPIRFESARYNPPWTPPFLMRNEMWAVLAN